MRMRNVAADGTFCLSGIVALSLSFPSDFYGQFFSDDYVSKFARSGVEAIYELATHGLLESDATVTSQLKSAPAAACSPAGKLPHIILLHDESSFDITAAPGIKVPSGLSPAFQVVRRRVTATRGRRRRRAELVHRVQRAHRTVGALLWPFRHVGNAHCGRAGCARAAACAAADAAIRRSACIRSTAPFSVRATSRPRPASSAIWT